MHPNELMGQALEYQKQLFNNSYAIMTSFHDQGRQILDMTLEKTIFVPQGVKSICSYWADYLQQNRQYCKEYIDKGFDGIQSILSAEKEEAQPTVSQQEAAHSNAEKKK